MKEKMYTQEDMERVIKFINTELCTRLKRIEKNQKITVNLFILGTLLVIILMAYGFKWIV